MATKVNFSWASAADVGMGIVSSLASALGSYGGRKARAEAETLVRAAQNETRRANTELATTIRNINNRRIMERAGQHLDQATRSALRTNEAMTGRRFEESIQAAEQWGEQSARAAASGLGGSGIQAMSSVTNLQIARRKQAFEERAALQISEASRATEGVMGDAFMSMDFSTPQLNYDMRQAESASLSGALIDGLLGGVAAKKDSLRTLLGSLVDRPARGIQSVDRDPIAVDRTPSWADTYPVSDRRPVGRDLGPLQAYQADVRRVDNVLLK